MLVGCGGSQHRVTRATPTTPPPTTPPTTVTTTAEQLPGFGKPQVVIGDKNFTEQFVLGQLYKQALMAQGFSVSLNPNIGPSEVTIQALRSGRLALYPEYLDTLNATIAGDRTHFDSLAAALHAAQSHASQLGFELLPPTPFSDTDAIGVTRGYAIDNSLRQIGDLRRQASSVMLGAPPQFQQSATGLPALEQAYGFAPAAFKALDVGSQYQALDQNTIQAADVNTTDGQLASGSYSLLADPQHIFGWGNVVPVVSPKVLMQEGPAFARTIEKVNALLSTETMRKLNAAVDVGHQDPAAVAKQFLQAHDLVSITP